jgi:hypothetical protein
VFRAVADSEVAAYRELIESLAKKYVKYPEADYDELFQEGQISVWEALRRGNRPSIEVIKWSMLAWLRNQRRLRRGDSIAALYMSLTPEWQAEHGTVLTGAGASARGDIPRDGSPA